MHNRGTTGGVEAQSGFHVAIASSAQDDVRLASLASISTVRIGRFWLSPSDGYFLTPPRFHFGTQRTVCRESEASPGDTRRSHTQSS